MKTFLIDLENVKNQGFTGIDKLAAEDRVFVFYSDGANTLNIPTIQLINRSACSVEYVPLQRSGHNAMDFQIVGLLGFLIGSEKQGYFGIISQDQGYLAPVEFFMDHSADVLDIHVLVTPNILTAVRKWETAHPGSRKVLTTGKQKNERKHTEKPVSETVIDVEPVQSSSTEAVDADAAKVEEIREAEAVVEKEPTAQADNGEVTASEATKVQIIEDESEKETEERLPVNEAGNESREEASVEEANEVPAEAVMKEEKPEEAETAAEKEESAEAVGNYVEEISNAFVGAIVDSADGSETTEETIEEKTSEVTEKKNSRSTRNKKKKTSKKNADNAAKVESETEKASAEAAAVVEEKAEEPKTDKKTSRPEKKKENRKNNKRAQEVTADPQSIQLVHNIVGEKLEDDQIQYESHIVKAVLVTDGKNHFYQYFNHTLGRETGGNLYHAIRNDYEKLVKALKA